VIHSQCMTMMTTFNRMMRNCFLTPYSIACSRTLTQWCPNMTIVFSHCTIHAVNILMLVPVVATYSRTSMQLKRFNILTYDNHSNHTLKSSKPVQQHRVNGYPFSRTHSCQYHYHWTQNMLIFLLSSYTNTSTGQLKHTVIVILAAR
jgi:hypothetical protein